MLNRLASQLRSVPVARYFSAGKIDSDSHSDFQPKVKVESGSAKDFIDKVVKGNKVVLFMKGTPQQPMCGFSNYVVQALGYYGVKDYYSVNVLEDNEVREEVKKYSDWPTLPQLYINHEFVGGCDILSEMHQKNELLEFLKKQGVVSNKD